MEESEIASTLTEAVVKETIINEENLKKSSAAQNEPQGKSSLNKPQVKLAVMSTRRYLDATIVPTLSRAMVALGKERPTDPIGFLANFLKKNVPHSQITDPDTPAT